jgi:hypothetical protein
MSEVVQCIYSPFQAKPYSFLTDIDLHPNDLVVVESGGQNNPFGVAIVSVLRTEGIPSSDAAKATKKVLCKIPLRG